MGKAVISKRVPVSISTVKTSDGREKHVATVPLQQLILGENSESLQAQLQGFAEQYEQFIASCKEVISAIELEKKLLRKVNPLLFWLLGDRIFTYAQQNEKGKLFLDGLYKHLSRDLTYSKSSLEKIVAFRRKFPRRSQIATGKSWDYYRENLYGKTG